MANPTITLTGRVGQEPANIGESGVRLRIVTNDRVKNDTTGEWEDKNTSWWTVKAWNKLADQTKAILKKGHEVVITGKIYEENWVDSNNIERTSYEIKAESIALTPYSIQKELSSKSQAGTPF